MLWGYCLEDHVVGVLALGKTKSGAQVLLQNGSLAVTLDGGQDLLVNLSLVLLPLLRRSVLDLLALKDVALLLLAVGLHAGKVLVVQRLWDVHLRDVNLGLCGDNKALVDSAQRAAIGGHGA